MPPLHMTKRQLIARMVLVGGLAACAALAVWAVVSLWRPIIPPELAARMTGGGGIGSVSAGGVGEDIVLLAGVAAMTLWLLASIRPWWALAYLPAAGAFLVGFVLHGIAEGDAFMAGLQARG